MSLKEVVIAILHDYKTSVISVGSHSPAYHFPDLPKPDAIFNQENAEPVCFWLKFDWHVMFAKAMSGADENLGFICLRPDERAKEPVGWKIRNNLLTIHCPSIVVKRMRGADCIEDSKSLLEYLEEIYKMSPTSLAIVMAPGSNFGRKVIKSANVFVPDGNLLAHALGDTPPFFSRSKLKGLLFNTKARDKLRFLKHLSIRIINQGKERNRYRKVSLLWVPTEESRKQWREFIDCSTAFTSGGYDAEVWCPGNKLRACQLLGLKDKETLILSNCVLIPKKRLDDLIHAVNLVRGKQDVKLIISGYGEESERKRLEVLVDRLDMRKEVIFAGYVTEEELVRLYQAADVFVHLSAAEGGPSSCKQALAVNLPVVMTPVGSVGKWIEKTGMGKIFPVGDIESCAKSILETLGNDKILETSSFAKELWSWEAIGIRMARDLMNFVGRESRN